MIERKKFGAFSGVFTPSILTILGVIMYMRLGWVVGQAGLIGTLLIIVLAHVVSITTGLSISSIATDKQVKKGGIYYMLSRSLGLPMGGAIGLALFIATAMGISLYIVGFTENFLGIEPIREFFNLGTSLNDIRLTGTIVLVVLTILGLISTSVVIKTQYLILGAIALSLISIFVGFLWQPASNPETVLMLPARDSLPMAAVFAVFFPAVTGFTAGVAMSGDLRNPKVDIPKGTIGAILTGLVIYISLVLVMAFFMPRSILLTDNNFLMHSAWIGGLVIAGIWGATLSSALGGILGGPRIMQAIAIDKILPSFLAKGHGKNNEPRQAIIATFLIAEAGILIGDLNAIAALVTMFYLTSYGFINLAYVLESWASSDFLPSLRVPQWLGIMGVIATFGIMFQMNPLAMIMSLVIMGGIYFILKRRELQLDLGDVWQSVWSSLVRSSLHHLDRKGLEERNWRPNIILFSGGNHTRPHLIEFGKTLVGKHGLISNFDLIEISSKQEENTSKHQQNKQQDNINKQGVFSRRQLSHNVYESIESIARNYGFAGVEPNTILMGWARHSKNPARFVQMINTLQQMDMNILLMDYDRAKGFNDRKTIDIWWRGGASNSHLAIKLVKFLWLSEKWQNAAIRLMIINQENSQRELIFKETTEIIEQLRIKAQVKIINNEIENKSLFEIVRIESASSDLVFMGLPVFKNGNAQEYIDNINDLCISLSNVILVGAAPSIKPLEINSKIKLSENTRLSNQIASVVESSSDIPELNLPAGKELASQLQSFKDQIIESVHRIKTYGLLKLQEQDQEILTHIKDSLKEAAAKVEQIPPDTSRFDRARQLLKIKQNTLSTIGNELMHYRDQQLNHQRDLISENMAFLLEETIKIVNHQPRRVAIKVKKEELKIHKSDSWQTKLLKARKKNLHALHSNEVTFTVNFRSLLQQYFPLSTNKAINLLLENWGIISGQLVVELQKSIEKIESSIDGLVQREFAEKYTNKNLRQQLLEDTLNHIDQLGRTQQKSIENLIPETHKIILGDLNRLALDLDYLKPQPSKHKKELKQQKRLYKSSKWIAGIPDKWHKNQTLFLNSAILETYLLTFGSRIQMIFNDISHETDSKFNKQIKKQQQNLLDQVNDLLLHKPKASINLSELTNFDEASAYTRFFDAVFESARKRIRLGSSLFPNNIILMNEDSFNEFNDRQYYNIETVKLSVSRFLDYIIQNELIAPLQKLSKEVPEQINKHNKSIREQVRLLDFTLTEKSTMSEKDMSNFIYQQNKKIKETVDQTTYLHHETLIQLRERANSFLNSLQFSIFRHRAFHSKQYILPTEQKNPGEQVKQVVHQYWKSVVESMSYLYYRQRTSLLKVTQNSYQTRPSTTTIEDLLLLIEKLTTTPGLLSSLPFYYRQLFLRRHNYLMDFRVGREKELAIAAQALKRYQYGYKGGLLITGERYSGKTFLTQYILNKLQYKSNIIQITPPQAGSVERNHFKNALIQATEKNGEYDDIFSDLPSNAVIVFEDIELWWENSSHGMQIIRLIMNIIKRYSKQHLFIITTQEQSFDLINRQHQIEHNFLSHIHCEPMSAKDIREAIMIRHRSGNLTFTYKNHPEDQLKLWTETRMFSKYFSLSKGNVGIALRMWIHHIERYEQGKLQIREPIIPDTSCLGNLEPDWYLSIVQILLHRQVNRDKLARLMHISKDEAMNQLNTFTMAGILQQSGQDIYEINPTIYPHLISKLMEMKII
ncbi:MAG: hypothetical protein R6T91_10025 [Bacteroidales bacterium]